MIKNEEIRRPSGFTNFAEEGSACFANRNLLRRTCPLARHLLQQYFLRNVVGHPQHPTPSSRGKHGMVQALCICNKIRRGTENQFVFNKLRRDYSLICSCYSMKIRPANLLENSNDSLRRNWRQDSYEDALVPWHDVYSGSGTCKRRPPKGRATETYSM